MLIATSHANKKSEPTMMPDALNPFDAMDIRSLILSQARQRPNKVFLIWAPDETSEQTWTYSEFADSVSRFAAGLEARGVALGDRVMVHSNNCPEQLIAWLGCAYAGAIAVTTNTSSSADELEYFARHSKAVAAITQSELVDIVRPALGSKPWIGVIGSVDNADDTLFSFEDLQGEAGGLITRPFDPMAPFGIQYTSGTTPRPKAVLWSHGNALWGARESASDENLQVSDVHLVHLPMFHTNAQVYSVLASMWVGATVVLQPKFSVSRFWPVSLKFGCTWTSMIPFCVGALMSLPVPKDHSYRNWGNAFCDPPSDNYFGIRSIGWWGMTETITHGIVGSPHLCDVPMSIGKPACGYEIHVLNEDHEPVQPGEIGDLFVKGVRGVSLFLEYHEDPDATAKVFRHDGLFDTGDRVRRDSSGYIFFADRSKDMLKVGGENVAASEVERVILETSYVQEAAVVAKSDLMRGEVPVAYVIPNASAPSNLEAVIIAACQGRLAKFKVPVEVRIVDGFPRAALNKVAKSELRARLLVPSGAVQ